MTAVSRAPRTAEPLVWTGLLLVAALLRLAALPVIPPGLTHDEANNFYDAVAVLEGARPIYLPTAYGHEPLYVYSVAAMMALIGRTPFALRLTSALWGWLLVPLLYAWTRRAFGRAVALWTTAGLAVAFWGVSSSRVGLRAVTAAPLVVAALLTARPTAPRPPGMRRLVMGGVWLGLALYTYPAARLMPPLLFAFALYRLTGGEAARRADGLRRMVTPAVALLVAAPLGLYLHAHPAAEARLGQLGGPLQAALHGELRPLLATATEALGAFAWRGDDFAPYNVPGRPFFGPVMAALFALGLGVALRRWRSPAHAFALAWMAAGYFPALATGADASFLRAILAQPVAYLFPALAISGLSAWVERRWPTARRWPTGAAAVLFALVALGTARDYFLRWANDRDVRAHYHVALVTAARRVQGNAATAFSTLYPGQYHDPRVVGAVNGGATEGIRWFDGRRAWVFPAAPTARLVAPAAVPPAAELWEVVAPAAVLSETFPLRPGDFNAPVRLYRWRPTASLTALRAELRPLPTPTVFGEHVRLLGYRLSTAELAPGHPLTVTTLWQVAATLPADRDAVIFVQLLGPTGEVVAQEDRLDAPSWAWYVGDAFAQLHRLTLPAGLPPGTFRLICGVYTVADREDALRLGHEPDTAMPRLPIQGRGEDFVVLRQWDVAP